MSCCGSSSNPQRFAQMLISLASVWINTTSAALIPARLFSCSQSVRQWSHHHQGGQPGVIPFVLAVVGICIILGATTRIYFLLPEGRAEEGNDGMPRLRYLPKHDRDWDRNRDRDRERDWGRDRGRDERRFGDDEDSAQQVSQEHGIRRQEQRLQAHISEDEPMRQLRQLQPDGDGRGCDAVWFKLTAAGSPVRRHQCLSPPCREVRMIRSSWRILYALCFFSSVLVLAPAYCC